MENPRSNEHRLAAMTRLANQLAQICLLPFANERIGLKERTRRLISHDRVVALVWKGAL